MNEYSIHEAAKLTGISVRSLRNYLRLYRDHFEPRRGACNALVLGDEEIKLFVTIRTLLREGRSRRQIQETLGRKDDPEDLVIRRREENLETLATPENSGSEVLAPKERAFAEALAEQLRKQTELMERLIEENTAMRLHLESLERRLPTEAPPRTIPVRRRGALELPVPYFLLRAKDGARAVLTGIVRALSPSTKPKALQASQDPLRPGSSVSPRPQDPNPEA